MLNILSLLNMLNLNYFQSLKYVAPELVSICEICGPFTIFSLWNMLNFNYFQSLNMLTTFYFQSFKYVDHLLFSVCEICWPCSIFSLWTPQTRQVSNRDDTEKLKEQNKSRKKWEKAGTINASFQAQRSTEIKSISYRHHHLTSAKSTRAPTKSGAQCTQYIFILQVIFIFWNFVIKVDTFSTTDCPGEKWPSKKHLIQESAFLAATLWLLQPTALGQKPRRWQWPIFATKPSLVRANPSSSVWLSMVWRIQVKTFSAVEKDLKKLGVKGPP